jgi:hypothetical protein
MDWQTLRNQFMRAIGGDPPGSQLEDELIAAYTDHPTVVERSIEKITLAYQAGKIRSPWGALKAEVAKAVDAARNPTHDKGSSKQKAIARAEQRTRNELLHYDRWEEAEDELFGDRGTLRDHDNPTLRQRMETLWTELRPAGELVEAEAEERARRYVEQRAALAAARKHEPAKTPSVEVKDGVQVEA